MSAPDPFEVQQSDGQTITLQIHGDPYDNYMTDLDGYTVVKDSNGSFVYAQPNVATGTLDPSTELVTENHHHHDNDEDRRRQLLLNTPKHLRPTKRDCRDMICEEHQHKQHQQQQYQSLLRGAGKSSFLHSTTNEKGFLSHALNLTMTDERNSIDDGNDDDHQINGTCKLVGRYEI